MRKIAVVAVALLLGSAGVVSGLEANGSGEYRVKVRQKEADRHHLSVRNQLEGDRVSVEVSGAQLAVLQAEGAALEVVPQRWVTSRSAPKTRNPMPPPSQVPYGVRMMYGNPSLTAKGVGGGKGITVAVLDTGIIEHPDFRRPDGTSIVAGCADFTRKKAPIVPGSCADRYGHGTHVTGTIAAAGGVRGMGIFGVAPGVKILSYKVLNDQGVGYADDIARAIRMAADRGANIISLSLGAPEPFADELYAIRYAVAKGVLVIAAAGNAGPDAGTIGYPAAFPEVVAVGALGPDEIVDGYSSRGITDGNDSRIAEREIEVAAPGVDVLSTFNNGDYAWWSGTSMAAPHIAGLAAKNWQGSAVRTRTWLQRAAQAHDITSAAQLNNAAVGYDIASGYGLPQVTPKSVTVWVDGTP